MDFKKILLVSQTTVMIVMVLNVTSVLAQFQSGHVTVTFTDPSRNDREIETEIFYPSDISGDDVPLAATGGQFPVLVFGHGFLMGYDAYENLWSAVVPEGFIMAFPKTEGGILPSHEQYGLDLAFVTENLSLLGNDPSSIFYNRISALNAVMGHSMGGGAALLAAESSSVIAAFAVLAPAETNPSAIAAASSISLPGLVIAGSNDCVTPPAGNQVPMYEALVSECKTFLSIIGGSHCQMANSNFFCGIGEATCTPQPDISREEQHQVIYNYMIPWLKSRLKSDCDAGAQFDAQIISDTAITYQKNCLLCETLSISENDADLFVYPNPFDDNIFVNVRKGDVMIFVLYDMWGRKLLQEQITDQVPISSDALASGQYFYKLLSGNNVANKGMLIKR